MSLGDFGFSLPELSWKEIGMIMISIIRPYVDISAKV